MAINQTLRQTLLELERLDQAMRVQLIEEGRLFDGYVKEMEDVHVHNAQRLQTIIDEFGWPGQAIVDEDGATAAWHIAQHAIGLPDFQRNCLALIRQAVKQGDMPAFTEAYLTDRIRYNQREPQLYGTIFDWDEYGEMSPWPIEDAENVETRRLDVGMPSLEEDIQKMRERVREDGGAPPASCDSRQQEITAWAKKVGWMNN